MGRRLPKLKVSIRAEPHSARGKRPAEEIARFSGKEVRVTGTLHERTPSQSEDGVVMQTMIGPYIGEIERIEATGR